MFQEWVPRSFSCLRRYNFSLFKKDLAAGLTVGVVALPLAMAFGIASGVSPEKGIFTAIVAGFLISLLGGSTVQIGGPTGAFVVIVYDVLERTGYDGLALATLLAALLLIFFSLCRMGSWIKYVPYPLITGFTTGISFLIFSSQLKDFFGLQVGPVPEGLLFKWQLYCESCTNISIPSFAVGMGTLLLIYLFRQFLPKVPWGIASLVCVTALTIFLKLPVPTIYSKFGALPSSLPALSLPNLYVPFEKLSEVIRDALTIAFLGGIESLLSAVVADGMLGTRHKSNCELLAQGVANLGSILFGGIPATGAIARTATNIKSGAQTPMAGMIHAATLWGILLCLSPLVSQIPLPSLSAILIVVAWNMSELPHFIRLIRHANSDTIILLASFFLTVFVDITVAIMVGMVLASFLFMKQVSLSCKALPFPDNLPPVDLLEKKHIPKEIEVYELQGPFFFGSADILQNLIDHLTVLPKVFILRMRQVPLIDASGVQALKEFSQQCHKKHIALLLSDVQPQIKKALEASGSDHIFSSLDQALAKARTLIG